MHFEPDFIWYLDCCCVMQNNLLMYCDTKYQSTFLVLGMAQILYVILIFKDLII